jgi:hypothetical protein
MNFMRGKAGNGREALRRALLETEAALAAVAFTSRETAAARLAALDSWPGDAAWRSETAAAMEMIHRHKPRSDLLELWKEALGFPDGSLERILTLSDPPWYTACPNPFLAQFLENGQEEARRTGIEERSGPFTADVREGKNDPVYNAHSYHTKVPYRAIMHYILHYTEPGSMVMDGFCGAGMTGVAAQYCGNRACVESLGYRVTEEGCIHDRTGNRVSLLGERRALLKDLSPAATHIARHYNASSADNPFTEDAGEALARTEEMCGWMYLTLHEPSRAQQRTARRLIKAGPEKLRGSDLPLGRVSHVIWSDVCACTHCGETLVLWAAARDPDTGKPRRQFPCPACRKTLEKKRLRAVREKKRDPLLGKTMDRKKTVPVRIVYQFGKKRFEKEPGTFDETLLRHIDKLPPPDNAPALRLPEGRESRRNDRHGITHAHQFFSPRTLHTLAVYAAACRDREHALWALTAVMEGCSKLNRERASGLPSKLSGTLYVGSFIRELDVCAFLQRKIRRYAASGTGPHVMISTESCASPPPLRNCIDYIFTDPPFGGNLMYAELNFIWESWLGITTRRGAEAVENRATGKNLAAYRSLMTAAFRHKHAMLKPGRWMTVVFHNSDNRVWNALMASLDDAGFILADIRMLDKKQGSFKQVNPGNTVKSDLVLSLYKPAGAFQGPAPARPAQETGFWEYLAQHLAELPLPEDPACTPDLLAERRDYLLFGRMVAWHMRRGLPVPLDAAGFYRELRRRFRREGNLYFAVDN